MFIQIKKTFLNIGTCPFLKLIFIQGEKSFFLMPGEKLEKGIQNVYILGEDEGLILRSTETFKDRDAGEKVITATAMF